MLFSNWLYNLWKGRALGHASVCGTRFPMGSRDLQHRFEMDSEDVVPVFDTRFLLLKHFNFAWGTRSPRPLLVNVMRLDCDCTCARHGCNAHCLHWMRAHVHGDAVCSCTRGRNSFHERSTDANSFHTIRRKEGIVTWVVLAAPACFVQYIADQV